MTQQLRYSGKRNRTYKRAFDRDEARRRYAEGESMLAIAQALGVSRAAIWVAIRKEDKTYAEPVFETNPLVDRHHDLCPTCQGQKTRRSIMCKECRKDARLAPMRRIRIPGKGRTKLQMVEFGRIVLYQGRWAVVEPNHNNHLRWRELHYWDGPPERVSVNEYVTQVLPATRFEEQ